MKPADVVENLARLATNHRWTWRAQTRRLLSSLPTSEQGLHPVAAVGRLSDTDIEQLSSSADWLALLAEEAESLSELLAETIDPDIVYFSPEYAIDELIPQYSGGLGILAGDHLKAASDAGVSLGGVGLFYRQGFFRQSLNGDGQAERYELHHPTEFGATDTGVTVSVPMAHGDVVARVWRLEVGRSPLLLLDTEVAGNSPDDVAICDRLYGSDRSHRLRQELLLGVGGARAVVAVGWKPRVVHLNEGHAGFVVLPLIDEALKTGRDLDSASAEVREKIVFTTHTPVPAGIERFKRELVEPHLAIWADRWSVPVESVLALGADPVGGTGVFNMTALCLRHARAANGVSRLHGSVSRRLFADMAGGDRIGFVTNGVHARSWVHPDLQDLFDQGLGTAWSDGDREAWIRAESIDARDIVRARAANSRPLAALVERRTGHPIDPDAMLVGFARRFAPYKRATLLLRQEERLLELLQSTDRPVQLLYAGKAHPADTAGKELLAELLRFSRRPEVAGRLVFVPGYDMEVARAMVAGCDVWLNTPIRLREASGTSGEKVALNGGLNCSVLDGWWAEMFDGANGWEISSSDAVDPDERDEADAASAMDVLFDIAEEYFESFDSRFIERIRYGWMTLGPQITAARMVRDYQDQMYGPALSRV